MLLVVILPVIAECLPCPLHVVHVAEALVIYSQLELVPMLHDIEHVVPDVEEVLEGGAELLNLEYHLVVSIDLLLPGQMRTDEFNGNFF